MSRSTALLLLTVGLLMGLVVARLPDATSPDLDTSAARGAVASERTSPSPAVSPEALPTPTATPPSSPPAVPSPVAPPTPTPAATPTPPAEISVALAGDVHGEPPIRGVLDAGDNPLAGMSSALTAADLTVVNVETAVGELGQPADKSFTFQAPTSLWPALVAAGVDVVSLANNHALDFGVDALLETIDGARAAGLVVVGAGRNAEEAYAPALVDVGGSTVAVLGLTRVIPVVEWAAGPDRPGLASAYDPEAAAAAVEAAAAQADHVVVAVHWGGEGEPCPNEVQRDLALRLTAAGADVVGGHHPHVLQGIASDAHSVVAYSLGNFVFYARSESARETGVLTVTFTGDARPAVEFAPARIDDSGAPQPLEGAAAEALRARIDALSPGGGACPH